MQSATGFDLYWRLYFALHFSPWYELRMPGIVVVTYNSADVIDGCLDACLRVPSALDRRCRQRVFGRHCRSRPADRPGLELIANKTNRGFAGAVNQGFAALEDQQAILILNPDRAPVTGDCRPRTCGFSRGCRSGDGPADRIGREGTAGFNVRSLPSRRPWHSKCWV